MEWVVCNVSGINSLNHYLDDLSNVCAVLLSTLQHMAGAFGIPLAGDKTEGLNTALSFLGIVIDSEAMECRLPKGKLMVLKGEIQVIQGLRKIQLRKMQSLLGKLNVTSFP